jgi:hypothetical protein
MFEDFFGFHNSIWPESSPGFNFSARARAWPASVLPSCVFPIQLPNHLKRNWNKNNDEIDRGHRGHVD